jgi:carbonic anhydrase
MRNPSTIDQSIVEKFVEHAEQHRRELQPLDRRLVVRSFLDTREA